MHKKLIISVLLAAMACAFMACGENETLQPQPKTVVQTGDWAKIFNYPFLKFGKMSNEKIGQLGLIKSVIKKPLLVYNYKGGRNWWLETLPRGTEVAVDITGRPWYKVDCSNRVYVPMDKICPVIPPPSPGHRFPWDWNLPWWLFPLLFLLLLIPLLLWLLLRKRGEKEPGLHNSRAEHVPDPPDKGRTKGAAIIPAMVPIPAKGEGKKEESYIPSSVSRTKKVEDIESSDESLIGIVYESNGIRIPNAGLKEVKGLKASNGSIFIDVILNKPVGEVAVDCELNPGEKGVTVGLSPDGSFNFIGEGIKPGSEIRLGKENAGSVFVQAEIAKP